MHILSTIALLFSVFLGIRSVHGQQAAGFQCRSSENATAIDVASGSFDEIFPGDSNGSCSKNGKFLAPESIHWHIYSTTQSTAVKISMYPPGLVAPSISDRKLTFSIQDDALRDLSKGDSVQAGVNLYIPADWLKKISVGGIDEIVEIIHNANVTTTTPLQVSDSGVDNLVSIISPNVPVSYRGSGVDIVAHIEAASGSSIDLSGVDNTVNIKTVDNLNVEMSGIDQQVWIEGSYDQVKMTGIDGDVRVNGVIGCDNVSKKGIDNSCKTTDEVLTVPELACLADTEAVKYSCATWVWWNQRTIGVAVGALLLLTLIVGLCIFCCCRCCGNTRSRNQRNYPVGPVVTKVVTSSTVEHHNHANPGKHNVQTEVVEPEILVLDTTSSSTTGRDVAATDKDLIRVETGVGYTID